MVAPFVVDSLGATRDGTDAAQYLQPYLTAFAAIDADSAHLLVVADDEVSWPVPPG